MGLLDPFQVTELSFLLICSSLFSGLNLGIMSLDVNGLEVLMRVGEEDTKRYANAILPIRKTGNWILCTLLLGNTLVNSVISILLADLTSGVVGSLAATGLIVIFGEIMPQSICSRHGLAVGYYTRFFTYFAMALLSPVAYPVAKFLDLVIRGEISHIFSRKELKEFISLHAADQGKGGELDVHEVEIMSGALEIGDLTVGEVCTPMSKVNILSTSDTLDRKTIINLARDGHSRVPVANDDGEIIGVLLIKSLLLLDPVTSESQKIEQILKESTQPFLVTPMFVDRKEKLDDTLNRFLKDKKQIAFVFDHTEKDTSNLFPDVSFSQKSGGGAGGSGKPEDIRLDRTPSLERSKSYWMKKRGGEKSPIESTSNNNGGIFGGKSILIGVITMEDVMEALLKHSIDDEVDAVRVSNQPAALYREVRLHSSHLVYTRPASPNTNGGGPLITTASTSTSLIGPLTPRSPLAGPDNRPPQFPTWRKFQKIFTRARSKKGKKYGAFEESKSFYAGWQMPQTASSPFLRRNSEPSVAGSEVQEMAES